MTSISAPGKHRQWDKKAPLNSSAFDYYNEAGYRVSTPIYVDVPLTKLKDQFNLLRSLAAAPSESETPKTQSGITVDTFTSNEPVIEGRLGMTLDNLRMVLFSRGSVDLGLLLRIQSITGDEIISVKDLEAAYKSKLTHIRKFIKDVAK